MPTARRSESRPCGDGPVHRGEVPDGRTCRRCYRVSLNWSRLGACRPRRVDDRRPAPAASDVSRIRTRAPRDREPDHGPDGVPSFGASACAAGRRPAMIRPPEIIRPREGAPMPAPNLSNPALGRRTLIRGGLGAASLSRSQGRNRATVDRDTQPRSASRPTRSARCMFPSRCGSPGSRPDTPGGPPHQPGSRPGPLPGPPRSRRVGPGPGGARPAPPAELATGSAATGTRPGPAHADTAGTRPPPCGGGHDPRSQPAPEPQQHSVL